MPQLEITRAALAPQHARTTANYLFAVMLWPGGDQAPQRSAFLQSYDADRLIEQIEALPGTFRPEMLRQIQRAKHPDDLAEEVKVRSIEGMTVGAYYGELIVRHMAGAAVSPKDQIGRMTSPEWRKRVGQFHPAADIGGKSKFEALLHEYRPAALLLAALWYRYAMPLDLPWERVGEFLALTEWLRRKAESIPVARRAETLLPPDRDLWRVPPYLALPRGHLELAPGLDAAWIEAFDQKRLPHDSVG